MTKMTIKPTIPTLLILGLFTTFVYILPECNAFLSPQSQTHIIQKHHSNNESIKTTTSSPSQLPPTQRHTTTTTTTLHLAKKSGTKKKKIQDGTIAVNRKARRNYEVLSTYDAGISLLGSEVKAIRQGKLNLGDGFVRPLNNGRSCTLYNVHIGKNPHSGEYFQHEERRPRPLLLHKEETRKLAKGVEQKGFTIVPLKAFYSSRNQVKVQIGLCRGKNVMDKRNTIKDREMKKDADRMIKNFRAF